MHFKSDISIGQTDEKTRSQLPVGLLRKAAVPLTHTTARVAALVYPVQDDGQGVGVVLLLLFVVVMVVMVVMGVPRGVVMVIMSVVMVVVVFCNPSSPKLVPRKMAVLV